MAIGLIGQLLLLRTALVLFLFTFIAGAIGTTLGTALFGGFGLGALLFFALLFLTLLTVLFLLGLLRQYLTCKQPQSRTQTQGHQSFVFHDVLLFIQRIHPNGSMLNPGKGKNSTRMLQADT